MLAVLGVADADLILAAADAIAAGDGRAALEVSERLARSGRDVTQFARDLLAHLRQLIVIRTIGEAPDSFTVTAAEPERLRAQAEAISELTLGRSVDTLSKALADIREGDEPRMTVELALLRCARPQLDPSREALRGAARAARGCGWRRGGGRAMAASGPAPEAALRPRPERCAAAASHVRLDASARPRPPTPEPPTAEERRRTAAPQATAVVEGLDLEKLVGLWPAVVEQVRESGSELLSQMLARGAAGRRQRRGGGARGRVPGLGRVQQAQGRGDRGARSLRRRGEDDRRRAPAARSTCCSTATRPRRRPRRSCPRRS